MLHKVDNADPSDGNLRRQWFADEYFDLFVWTDDKGAIMSFQLCYDKGHDEHALTWKDPSTYVHQRVDDGESHPGRSKATPILLADGIFNFKKIADRFKSESTAMSPALSGFVYEKLLSFGNQ